MFARIMAFTIMRSLLMAASGRQATTKSAFAMSKPTKIAGDALQQGAEEEPPGPLGRRLAIFAVQKPKL